MAIKNFHLPLPEDTWAQLMKAAECARVPATALARQAIDAWLDDQRRAARHQAIASWAAEMAATDLDLDPKFEAAGIEYLTGGTSGPK